MAINRFMFVKRKDDAYIDFQSAAEVFYFSKIAPFFYDSTRRSPLGEMTLAGFMRIVKSGRFAIKATVLRFILNFIMQMTGTRIK